jgi:D-glycero-alpha-D-manno-heptose-7-phosphate kinase
MNQTKIISRAPTRIDLAGGTVDIWPLYLFLQDPITINLGIDLFAEAILEEKTPDQASGKDKCGITLRAEDQKTELKLPWKELHSAVVPPALELHIKLLRFFATERNFETEFSLSTRALSPAGAGLGGSSALSIAMIGALSAWAEKNTGKRLGLQGNMPADTVRLIDIVRDVETTVIKVPAGLQDYYGAMYGGLQTLRWLPGFHEREPMPEEILTGLEKRLVLFYSGQSRNSGINNWALFKNFIDRDQQVQSKFTRINDATHKLRHAFLKQNWKEAGAAIAEEWEVRRTLAPGITTPEIDQAFEIASRKFPGVSGKICGAGGGGCFFLYFPEPLTAENRSWLTQELEKTGVRHLPFRAVPKGLDVRA